MQTVSHPAVHVHNELPDDVSASIARAAEVDAVGTRPYVSTGFRDELLSEDADTLAYEQAMDGIEDEPCTCCRSRSDVIAVADSDLSICHACIATMAVDRDGADVARFLADQDLSPVPCPRCGWRHQCRNAGQLAQHLARLHGLTDAHVASVVVHAIECRDERFAA